MQGNQESFSTIIQARDDDGLDKDSCSGVEWEMATFCDAF